VEGFVEVGNRAVIEAPFALFDEQVEMLFGDAVIGPKVALGLAPEVLYAVDVVGRFSKQFRVIDAVVAELRNVENIIRPKAIRIDDTIRSDFLSDDGQKCLCRSIRDDDHMDIPLAF